MMQGPDPIGLWEARSELLHEKNRSCKQVYGAIFRKWKYICCCCSVAKLRLTLCDPMDCTPSGSFVLHYLLELAEIHVH